MLYYRDYVVYAVSGSLWERWIGSFGCMEITFGLLHYTSVVREEDAVPNRAELGWAARTVLVLVGVLDCRLWSGCITLSVGQGQTAEVVGGSGVVDGTGITDPFLRQRQCLISTSTRPLHWSSLEVMVGRYRCRYENSVLVQLLVHTSTSIRSTALALTMAIL